MKKNQKSIDLEEQKFGLFITNESYDLDISMARDYLQTDINSYVKLHRVNIIETKAHSLYGQAKSKDKKYLAPITIIGRVTINSSTQEIYGGDNGLVRDDTGTIEVSFFLNELDELGVDINRGDIIEYNLSGNKPRFYEVDNANNVVDSTKMTFGGFVPVFRKVTGVPAKVDVANLL